MRRLLAAVLILGALATLLALGTWQMQRLAWKEALIAEASSRPALPPVPFDALVEEAGLEAVLGSLADGDQREAVDALRYRRATLEGRFVGEPVRVFTTLSDPNGALEGPGYWIMQGFETSRSIVFVNRGFIPFELPPGMTVRDAPAGPVRFEGLIRPDDPAIRFTPDPDYGNRLLYRRSVAQLMRATGISVALPVTVDMPASPAGGLPQAGETKFTFTNRHLEYALTWYGLAVVLVAVTGAAWWRRRAA